MREGAAVASGAEKMVCLEINLKGDEERARRRRGGRSGGGQC